MNIMGYGDVVEVKHCEGERLQGNGLGDRLSGYLVIQGNVDLGDPLGKPPQVTRHKPGSMPDWVKIK